MIRELYLKGISREVADKVIEEVLQGENTDERALAERVVEKKRRTLSRAGEERVLRRRLRNHLIRRGFDGPVVRDVLDDVFSADDGSRDG
jgi:SOS response regulatory protein OraA/RecX